MKASKHEVLKAQWQRTIREAALIKAGTLAITGQTIFVKVRPSTTRIKTNNQGTCAILCSNGNEIENQGYQDLILDLTQTY